MGTYKSNCRQTEVTCPDYNPISAQNKRCSDYRVGGACGLPHRLMCVEWLKGSSHPSDDERRGPEAPSGQAPLFPGLPPPTPRPRTKRQPQRPKPERPAPWTERSTPQPEEETLTEHSVDVHRLKALDVEVCISCAAGRIWLVLEYTAQARDELSVEDAAALVAVTRAFPDARVVAFERSKKEANGCPI